MKNRILILCVVLVGLCGSTALALDPMGPPKAGLQDGQFSVGIEYSYSDMDLGREQFAGSAAGLYKKFSVKTNKVYAKFGYGISDKVEGFLRFGGADMDYKRNAGNGNWEGDDSSSFAVGGGFKLTFTETESVAWGLLAQLSWADFSGKRSNPDAWTTSGNFKTEITELQLAAGPTFKLDNGVSIYGGPFLHFVDGKHYYWGTDDQTRGSDLKQKAELGGYIGAQVDLSENTALNVEYQDTTEAWAIAGGVKFKF